MTDKDLQLYVEEAARRMLELPDDVPLYCRIESDEETFTSRIVVAIVKRQDGGQLLDNFFGHNEAKIRISLDPNLRPFPGGEH